MVYFTLSTTLRDDENEVMGGVFDVCNPTANPNLTGLTVTVYND